ncbi:MAG: hypothetical protein OXU73_01860 [Candidatus Campbellbacteria bacterium]|nr:hypothetical protein [Candidatus Campbellbacteria bacterium]
MRSIEIRRASEKEEFNPEAALNKERSFLRRMKENHPHLSSVVLALLLGSSLAKSTTVNAVQFGDHQTGERISARDHSDFGKKEDHEAILRDAIPQRPTIVANVEDQSTTEAKIIRPVEVHRNAHFSLNVNEQARETGEKELNFQNFVELAGGRIESFVTTDGRVITQEQYLEYQEAVNGGLEEEWKEGIQTTNKALSYINALLNPTNSHQSKFRDAAGTFTIRSSLSNPNDSTHLDSWKEGRKGDIRKILELYNPHAAITIPDEAVNRIFDLADNWSESIAGYYNWDGFLWNAIKKGMRTKEKVYRRDERDKWQQNQEEAYNKLFWAIGKTLYGGLFPDKEKYINKRLEIQFPLFYKFSPIYEEIKSQAGTDAVGYGLDVTSVRADAVEQKDLSPQRLSELAKSAEELLQIIEYKEDLSSLINKKWTKIEGQIEFLEKQIENNEESIRGIGLQVSRGKMKETEADKEKERLRQQIAEYEKRIIDLHGDVWEEKQMEIWEFLKGKFPKNLYKEFELNVEKVSAKERKLITNLSELERILQTKEGKDILRRHFPGKDDAIDKMIAYFSNQNQS